FSVLSKQRADEGSWRAPGRTASMNVDLVEFNRHSPLDKSLRQKFPTRAWNRSPLPWTSTTLNTHGTRHGFDNSPAVLSRLFPRLIFLPYGLGGMMATIPRLTLGMGDSRMAPCSPDHHRGPGVVFCLPPPPAQPRVSRCPVPWLARRLHGASPPTKN